MKIQILGLALGAALVTSVGFAAKDTQASKSLKMVSENVATVATRGNGSGRGIGNGSGRGIGNGSGRGIGNGRGRVVGFTEARN